LKSAHSFLSSFFLQRLLSRDAGMTGDLRQVSLGALTVRVQLRAELAHNSQISVERQLKKAFAVPRSQRLRDTTGRRFQRWKASRELTTS
jgi:hypothetical protein